MLCQLTTLCGFFAKSFCALFITLTFFSLILAAHSTNAATITVTNTADSGAGSLRQAIADANATTDGDTINFNFSADDPNCNRNGGCTITLTSGLITIQSSGGSLTISNQTGAGKLSISGNNVNRIFEARQNTNLTLDGLTITNGLGGGTVGGFVNGVVTSFRGTLTIMNSIVTQNSGNPAIAVDAFGSNGNLTVVNTMISNNSGRGIFFSNGGTNGGTLNIVNSTISNNVAAAGDGGGGIRFVADHLRMTNSTVSGNIGSEGGLYIVFPPSLNPSVVLTNCTITNNRNTYDGGGGIELYRAGIKIRNTIISGNTNIGGASDIRYWNAGITSLGNNLIGTATLKEFGDAQWLSSDKLNQNVPQLSPLANNGGLTSTHALLPNSPAINAGNNCVLTENGCGDNNPAVITDQRGQARVGTVDIGAFEFSPRSTAFDFDGDGQADVAVFRPSTGYWYTSQNSATNYGGVLFGQAEDKIVPADYDGDGRADIAVYRNGIWYLQRSLQGFAGVAFGNSTDIPVPADYNGDGKAEIAVFRPSNGYWYLLNLENNQFTALPFGQNGDKPVAADYDGDGKADIAVNRNGNWYIQRSQFGFYALLFGYGDDKLVPADYDGDGKTDIAVFRSIEGTWYIQGSSSGFTSATYLYGFNLDIPVPADYDGDGKADIAFVRTNTWYLSRSTQGFIGIQFGTNNDKHIPNAYVR